MFSSLQTSIELKKKKNVLLANKYIGFCIKLRGVVYNIDFIAFSNMMVRRSVFNNDGNGLFLSNSVP
jgi:hypothetical protein